MKIIILLMLYVLPWFLLPLPFVWLGPLHPRVLQACWPVVAHPNPSGDFLLGVRDQSRFLVLGLVALGLAQPCSFSGVTLGGICQRSHCLRFSHRERISILCQGDRLFLPAAAQITSFDGFA